MTRATLQRILWACILLSLIPGFILAVRRVEAEGISRTVTVVMDEPALAEQAAYLGVSSFELGERYRALGLNGIALYEDAFDTAETAGRILMLTGAEARELALSLGGSLGESADELSQIPANSTLVTGLEPDIMPHILAKNAPAPQEIVLDGRTWYAYPGEGDTRPAGPDLTTLERWSDAGWDIAYRPRNYPNLMEVGEDFPEEAHYLIHSGLQVAGQPDGLSELVRASQGYITGVIEGTAQDGMGEVIRKIPTARLLSFNQDYINQLLKPGDLVDKYLLAANERGVRILYLRPYTEEQLGDMVANTEALVGGLRRALEADGFTVGPLETLELNYQTNTLLRGLSAVGVVAALGLLALLYPGVWGPLVAAAVLGLGVVAGGVGWDALALAAALGVSGDWLWASARTALEPRSGDARVPLGRGALGGGGQRPRGDAGDYALCGGGRHAGGAAPSLPVSRRAALPPPGGLGHGVLALSGAAGRRSGGAHLHPRARGGGVAARQLSAHRRVGGRTRAPPGTFAVVCEAALQRTFGSPAGRAGSRRLLARAPAGAPAHGRGGGASEHPQLV